MFGKQKETERPKARHSLPGHTTSPPPTKKGNHRFPTNSQSGQTMHTHLPSRRWAGPFPPHTAHTHGRLVRTKGAPSFRPHYQHLCINASSNDMPKLWRFPPPTAPSLAPSGSATSAGLGASRLDGGPDKGPRPLPTSFRMPPACMAAALPSGAALGGHSGWRA